MVCQVISISGWKSWSMTFLTLLRRQHALQQVDEDGGCVVVPGPLVTFVSGSCLSHCLKKFFIYILVSAVQCSLYHFFCLMYLTIDF